MRNLTYAITTVLLFSVIFVFLFAGAGMGSAQDNNTGSKTYKVNYSQVWKTVMRAMSEGGDTVLNHDKESGTINTDWTVIKESALFARGWRAKQNLLIEKLSNDETKVSLKLIYQNKVGDSAWRPASSDNDYTPKIIKGFFGYLNEELNN